MKIHVKLIIILLSLFLLLPISSYSQTIVDRRTNATFSWDAVTVDINGNPVIIDHYELKLIRDVTLTEYNYATLNTQITVPKPKSGIYVVKVRAAKLTGPDTYVYSDWCGSITLCAYPSPWKVRFKPSAPTGPIIIY